MVYQHNTHAYIFTYAPRDLVAVTLHSYEPVKFGNADKKQGQVGSSDTCCPTQPEHDKYTDASIDSQNQQALFCQIGVNKWMALQGV